jgi:hypothetical protein
MRRGMAKSMPLKQDGNNRQIPFLLEEALHHQRKGEKKETATKP